MLAIGLNVLFRGCSLIKSLQMGIQFHYDWRNLKSTLTPRKHAIRWIQITVLLKFLIITRIVYTNVLTIIQSKSLPASRILTSLNGMNAQISDVSLGSLRLCKSILLFINKSEASYFFNMDTLWKHISQDRPKGVTSNLSVYRVSDYHISSTKCLCDRGNYCTV